MKRSLLFIPAALAMALTLSSCQSAAEPAPENQSAESATSLGNSGECLTTGEVSKNVTLDGDFDTELTLIADVPLVVEEAESVTLTEGDGGELNQEEIYSVGVALFNGRTGELLSQQREALPAGGSYQDTINSSIKCANVGDQSVIVMPASEFFGEGQIEAGAIPGFEAGDSLVVAMDFGEKVEILEQAEGTEVPLPEDAPEVKIADNGEPTITFPKDLKAPSDLTVYTMVEGEGPVVTEDQTVKVHYRGVIWRTGEEFDSSWVRGTAADFPVTGVIDGFKEALVGQTVGSRMLSLVPPAAGYGPEWLVGNGYEEDDVMVFVLDILSAS